MKRRPFTNRFLLVIVFVFSLTWCNAQTFTREIILTQNDTVYKFDIQLSKERIRTNDLSWYYWYNDNHINKNMGNYEGFLLHGRYAVFDAKKNLIVKGCYEKGQKDGDWFYWESDGTLSLKEEYNKGELINREIIGQTASKDQNNKQKSDIHLFKNLLNKEENINYSTKAVNDSAK